MHWRSQAMMAGQDLWAKMNWRITKSHHNSVVNPVMHGAQFKSVSMTRTPIDCSPNEKSVKKAAQHVDRLGTGGEILPTNNAYYCIRIRKQNRDETIKHKLKKNRNAPSTIPVRLDRREQASKSASNIHRQPPSWRQVSVQTNSARARDRPRHSETTYRSARPCTRRP